MATRLSSRARAAALAALLGAAAPFSALGAQQAAVEVTRLPGTIVSGEAGGTVTAGMRVANHSADSVVVTPRISAPAGWAVLLGGLPFTLPPQGADSWLVGLRIPARAEAGRYVVSIGVDAAGRLIPNDSLVVMVAARRGIELLLTEEPTYALSGRTWRAGFLVRNRGNVPATCSLRATSALGSRPELDATSVTLGPDETRLVRVSSATALPTHESHDDVLELFAEDAAADSVTATASARVTIVQRAGRAEARHTVASTLRMRAARQGVGVSPYELTGGGKLRSGGDEQVDFTLRGSAGAFSPFGDRDQYSLAIRAPTYEAKLGDAVYGDSPLLSSGLIGIGGGIDVTRGALGFGGFVDRSRYQLGGATEQSAFVRLRPDTGIRGSQLTLTGVNRSGGYFAGQLLGAAATLHPLGDMRVDLELAGSTARDGRGLGNLVHVSGGDRLAYDASHTMADDHFAGATRGNRHDYASLSARVTDDIQVSGSASSHVSSGGGLIGLLLGQEMRTASMEVAFASRFSVRYSSLTRSAEQAGLADLSTQRSIGGRVEQPLGPTHLWASGDFGRSSSAALQSRAYRNLSAGVSANLVGQAFSLYAESQDGAAVTLGAEHFANYGGDATLHLGRATTLFANGMRTRIPSMRGAEYGQLDVRVAQALSNGATASLRARLLSGMGAAMFGSRLVYLEYSMPLRLPTDQVRASGRVRGEVVSEETGAGIAGALVRLGPQAAITDANGRVAFAGVPAGQYRLSLGQQATRLETVFTGDATVQVDSARLSASTFRVSVQRAGAIAGSVRLVTVAKTGIGGQPDSLADAGPLEGATVALMGARDTLYRTSDEAGQFRFDDVVSGAWTVRVVDEAPELTRWEPQSQELVVRPGETTPAAFRRVPRRRAVRILNGDQSGPAIESVPNEDHRKQKQ